jgi:hypothetical protein
VLDRFLSLPTGANSYYGVLDREHSEDAALTRQLFGATIRELQQVTECFGALTGRPSTPYGGGGRVTFSRSRSNDCDLCGCLIPREFPYLAFEQSQYRWGHVSIHGFYRLLAFLCSGHGEQSIRRGLLDLGVERDLLDRLVDCGGGYHQPIAGNFLQV